MNPTSPSDPAPADVQSQEKPDGPPSVTATDASSAPPRRSALVVLYVAASLIGGLAAFAGIERFGRSLEPKRAAEIGIAAGVGAGMTPEQAAAEEAYLRKRDYTNTTLSLALFGLAAGAFLGIAAGMTREAAGAVIGLFCGASAGAAFGALGGAAEVYVYRLWGYRTDPLFRAMAGQAIAFFLAGSGIGLGAGLPVRRALRIAAAAAAAGLLAGVIYPGLAAALFPISDTNSLVPEGTGPLLLWTLLPAGLMGLTAARASAKASAMKR